MALGFGDYAYMSSKSSATLLQLFVEVEKPNLVASGY